MKRLSKDERIGAASLIIVSLLICGGSLLIRQQRQNNGAYGNQRELVKSIILARDSISEDSQGEGEERKKERGKNNKGGRKGKKGNGASKKQATPSAQKNPPRDHLSEPL